MLTPILLLAALGLPPAVAREPDVALTREVEVLIQPSVLSASGSVAGLDDLEVLVDGRESPSPARPADAAAWQVVIFVDFPLTSPEGVRRGTDLLAGQAESLVRLGPVSVVVSAPYSESWIEATTDATDLRETLEEVAAAADDAGDLTAARRRAARKGVREAGAGEPSEALARELELLGERRRELLGWLAMRVAGAGPRCLFLLGEQPSQDPGSFFLGADQAALEVDQGEGRDNAELARLLASWGWTVVPLVPQAPTVDSAPAEDRLRSLAEATGGAPVATAAELSEILASLGRGRVLRLRLDGTADGRPLPLVVRHRADGTTVKAPLWLAAITPEALSGVRARALVDGVEPSIPLPLPVTAVLLPAPGPHPSGRENARIEVLVEPGASGRATEPWLRLTLLLAAAEGQPLVRHELVRPGDLAGTEGWLYREEIEIPDDLDSATVVVEDLETGLWGGALAEFATRSLADGGTTTLRRAQPRADAAPTTETESLTSLIRLLPPRRRSVTGRVRFEALTGSPEVAAVEFLIDGGTALVDDRPPFSAVLDLGPEARARLVEVVARGRDGRALGRHAVTVNPETETFQVVITRVEAAGTSAAVEVEAEVSVAPGTKLERVEFYRNEELALSLEQGPYRTSLATASADATAYVRVVAYLTDGSWTEDARMLSPAGAGERVSVNLVELHVVVTDREQRPIRTLTAEDFTIRAQGASRTPERFASGNDLSLLLGLVIDTSESMWPLMPDTKKAGAQFLGETLAEGDRAFLVDFDTQPRLAQPATPDFMTLVRAFSRLEAGGFTALFDAVVFSLLQFEEVGGRRALVLLTDGNDYRSRYGPRRCIRYGRDLGVPVYFVSLAGVQDPRWAVPRHDLDSVSRGTGGRAFYISAMDQLTGAYARINEELRSQYVLAFSTERPLDRQELDAVEVSVSTPGLVVRTVVGGQRVD